MEFFATGGFQQLYSELDDSQLEFNGQQQQQQHQQQQQQQEDLDFCYADVNFGNGYDSTSMDYYGIITLDGNNNNNINVDNEQPFDYGDPVSISGASSSPPDLSDWEQRLLDHFVEIPELIDILPERTPLCTDMCDDFLQESNESLRLAAPTTAATATAATATTEAMEMAVAPLQLSKNAAGEKGYLCTFGNCEKLYAKPAHLKAHLRRHLGEKPYACSWPDCSWRFSRSDELARHRRSHSGVKPYKCDFCAKCFARSDHLTKHRKVHEKRLLAATRSGKVLPNCPLPQSVYAVRPGRKRKNQL